MTIYLYKKTHNKTGLQYLGKTTQPDPHKYKGSGVRWTNHIKKYGYDVTTEILKECESLEEATKWGQYYSQLYKVVEDYNWANLTEETGSGGAINKGKTTVKDENGNTSMVFTNMTNHCNNITGVAKGTVAVKDKNGNNFRVPLDDPRYLSGELVNNRTKMCYVRDTDNNELWIKYRDYNKQKERLEFIRFCPLNDYEGYAKTAKGAEKRKGRKHHTPQSLERTRQMGLRNKGRKRSEETKLKQKESRKRYLGERAGYNKEYSCPNCGDHFNKRVNINTEHNTYYCSKSCAISVSRKTSKISCPVCDITMDKSNYTKYHILKCHANDKK